MLINPGKYVPVLKWKQGEQRAVEVLPHSIKERMSPLLELPPIDWDYENECPKKTIDEHILRIGETLSASWAIEAPLFMDLIYIDPNERLYNSQHPVSYVMQEARNRNINLIPVTSPDRDTAYQNEVRLAHQHDQNGICIRLKEHDFSNLEHNITNLVSNLNVGFSEVDLIIDYEYSDPENQVRTLFFLEGLLSNITLIQHFRSVILIGTSFPPDLSKIGSNSIDTIERSEWLIWKSIIQTNDLYKTIQFGDYVISNPVPFDADPRFINMSANIRYTATDKYIIFKGKSIRKTGASQYFRIAAEVVRHLEYYGASYSNGDNYINEVANQNEGPGNATSWRKAGTNHHLTVVVNELSNLILP
ncbi:beta family protein [Paenibacillus nicotianae]|uniref:Beta family protein n=1 Tax=Paenibacillus nicotianae TaxID=1526551 RepID=A0ABW4UZ99_9BACL